jgi:lysyl-tRNA synthetase class 2
MLLIMSSLDEIRNERLKKLARLREAGVNPYPSDVHATRTNASYLADFDSIKGEETLVGRVMSLRGQGGLTFFDMFDGTTKVQVVFQKDGSSPKLSYDFFNEVIDRGDFVEVTGTPYTTKRGEKSLFLSEWRLLSKSLRPIPDSWYGLKDEDERYRLRYLDFILNDDARSMVEKRATFWRAVRRFHEDRGFLEVHTPVLETTTGGADANPFKTHHKALDLDVYLRISAGELWQKRLMVAGFPKTFEVGRIFRNEGMSHEHAQDYEQCEAYWAYASFKEMQQFLKECYQYVLKETFGTLSFSIRGFDVDLSGDWPEIDYGDEILRQTGVHIWEATEDDIRTKLDELKVSYENGVGKERLLDSLWKYCRKNIGGPVILINELKAMSPLAKTNPKDERLVERFHFVIAGSELGQGYSELNDPVDQRERFMEQQKLRDAGDEEAQMADMEFVEALEYGMPPTAGHGFSERVFSFFLGTSIRESQLFPLLRPNKDRER